MTRLLRSGLVTGATAIQLVLGLLWLALVVFLLWLMRSPEVRHVPDAREAVWGLKVAAGIIAPFAALALAGAYGMWRNALWGWWVALVTDLLVALVLGYSMIDDGWKNFDSTLAVVTAVSLALAILLLLPGVRRFYWRKATAEEIVA